MKKFLFFALAAAFAFTSCTKDETLATAETGAIAFENVFVDNATRAITPTDPSYKTGALMPDFSVYGYFDKRENVVFDAQTVTVATDGVCSYSPTQYWAPSHTYHFFALAPAKDAKWSLTTPNTDLEGLGKVTFENTGVQDLLYSTATATTDADIIAAPAKVKLTFKHLLSKVRFQFVNKFASSSYSFVVKNVTITNAAKTAVVDLSTATSKWDEPKSEDFNLHLVFGDVAEIAQNGNDFAATERLLIPTVAGHQYEITFDVELYVTAGQTKSLVDTYSHKVTLPNTLALEMGKSYNFKAEIDQTNVGGEEEGTLYPIEFEVEITDWEQATGDVTVTTPTVTTPAE